MDVPIQRKGPTVRQGCLLALGGVALAFFGCLGAARASSTPLLLIALVLGAAVIVWGFALIIHALAKGRTG